MTKEETKKEYNLRVNPLFAVAIFLGIGYLFSLVSNVWMAAYFVLVVLVSIIE